MDNFWKFLKELGQMLLIAALIAVLLKGFIIDSRVVPSLSMYPTVHAQDRVLLWKLAYLGDKAPERGDIVVFRTDEAGLDKEDLLKRTIGLPGETIEVKDGFVYVDDVALEEDYLYEQPDYDFGPVLVPDGCYLMLGDNRNQSSDSHKWADPFVPEAKIKGKVILRYWPFDRFGKLD